MGAACCIAAKKGTMDSGSPGTTATQRHSHYSPSWSFRWDNRGRVVGEGTTVHWLSNDCRERDYDRMEVKSGTTTEATFASDAGSSPFDSSRSLAWRKSPAERNRRSLLLPSPDPVYSRDLDEVKDLITSPSAGCPSPMKLSPSVSSCVATNSRGHHPFLRHVSDSRTLECRSFLRPVSTGVSHGGSSNGLSSAQRGRWSFDSQTSRNSGSSLDFGTCGVCSKLLTLRTTEIGVVSVLTCGHVYHSECLEYMTPDIDKYDPACPVCTLGDKRAAKMSEKALRAEFEFMARAGRSRNGSSQSSGGKLFLKRRFSFGSRAGRSISGSQLTPRKSFFWAKSSKY